MVEFRTLFSPQGSIWRMLKMKIAAAEATYKKNQKKKTLVTSIECCVRMRKPVKFRSSRKCLPDMLISEINCSCNSRRFPYSNDTFGYDNKKTDSFRCSSKSTTPTPKTSWKKKSIKHLIMLTHSCMQLSIGCAAGVWRNIKRK